MLPLVVKENTLFTFKFWLNDQIQEGMNYKQEMFCRLYTLRPQFRAQLYQFGCKLTYNGTRVVISITEQHCSLWVSLRDPIVKAVLIDGLSLDLPSPLKEDDFPDTLPPS
ncbi:hypothetical protein PN466_15820 [Roseofilum reptotaenium CS-1145]|uniref:Uncharacterized protein n=2 Tax=Roseofilum TaxID=1233426 RepID=A0A1L9QTY7_9CYAN|nr:hypothetical protein [Roseofilum reptotaenium CS-1145]OJJ26102.1 hypothetical protein BI308_07895 [Roseofilum reptotaenium AO1-A]